MSIDSGKARAEMVGTFFRTLFQRLEHEVALNAAAGYVLDPKLPAPEAFERPGWTTVWAGNEREYRIAYIAAARPLMAMTEEELAAPISIETRVVTPAVWLYGEHVFDQGEHFYGLGFDVDTRVYVLFSSARKPERFAL